LSPPSSPFAALAAAVPARSELRNAITAATRRPEPECVAPLLALAELPPEAEGATAALARRLVAGLRAKQGGSARENLVQGLLQEFSLSSDEGVALMCLAEALLRIPDVATRDALIRDKIGRGDWRAHLGGSDSPFINAATWGLLVTGRLVATHEERGLANALTRVTARLGEPVIRKAVDLGMRLMGKQFVAGETVAEALENARQYEALGFTYSYDMLGEAAMTAADAQRYYTAYEAAIHAIGKAAAGRGVYAGPGISIKLSALHPRYSFAKRERALGELYPRLVALARLARGYEIGINVDAEEADRLEISLDLLEALCGEPGLEGWNGIGFVIQAYSRRCLHVVDWVADLARRTQRRLMIRLVKGAYWDAEVKRAQVDGLEDYPVFTRKVHSDLAYLACARRLLAAPAQIYPQFATHNAQTLASIHQMAGPWSPGQYEFQCLHGMGEPLYLQVVGPESQGKLARPCRIYAPVGTHETLLAYLVRRLLENGSNSSFINRIADPDVSVEDLVESPAAIVRANAQAEGGLGLPHPRIPPPRSLFAGLRPNSRGVDLADEQVVARLAQALSASAAQPATSEPTRRASEGERRGVPVRNPARPDEVVGTVSDADLDDVDAALEAAEGCAVDWQRRSPADRAACLERAADAMEAAMPRLMALAVREAGKTYANAVAEVREAVDFLRYYAHQARARLDNATHPALGPVACISPWNFPLAIFTGQVSAALAAGNPVIAKPAEQTPLIAAEAVRILHEAGVPREVLQLLPGPGERVGARLVKDERVRGVVFTGSTEVARLIQRTLALRLDPRGRPVPLVAETGGQNAMIVDSSALAEQVVADAVVSAFDSAGQRCSALRLLCVQEEVAERILDMLRGAMDELEMGDPARLSVDVGPVIDASARDMLSAHVEKMRARGKRVHQPALRGDAAAAGGTFMPPTLVEIDRVEDLEREVFGPVLHVLRYRRDSLPALVDAINGLGFGLTLGVHSRVDEAIEGIVARARVGNVYVNRNIVGAVVGVQPFGGEGLSGTGPKAGGPLYLLRLLAACPPEAAIEELRALDETGVEETLRGFQPSLAPFEALRQWARGARPALASYCDRLAAFSPAGAKALLPGPTGERNTYTVLPRRGVLCLAGEEGDLLAQLAVVLSTASRAVLPQSELGKRLAQQLPAAARGAIEFVVPQWWRAADFDAVLHHGSAQDRVEVVARVAGREGPIASVHGFDPGEPPDALERLLVERVVSVNTAAAGGNATLMSVG
jgi:RHH-type proline utilization regulon transcriptional repressor/proline dehydrogenase/delta 1-pyrroline-5-carboxylate dehydrogenase